jgi:outer membrane protein assembly factor BamA
MNGVRLLQHPCRKIAGWLFSLSLLVYLSSCSGTSKLPEGKRLYTGATVKLESKEKIANEADLKTELAAVISPKPNTSFFGMRPGLFFYYLAGTPKKKKGLRSFIKNTLGEEPVFYDSVNAKHNADLMANRLNNNGYFNSTVAYKENIKDKTVSIDYTAQVAKAYTISEIIYPAGDSVAQIYRDLATSQPASLLKVGDNYRLATFTAERVRLDADLKNRGYFYFNPEFILFKVDTTQNDYTVKVFYHIKPEAPDNALRAYKLADIVIYSDFTLGRDTIPSKPPVRVRGYQYYPDEESLKAKHLLNSVFLEPGHTYRRRDHALTVSRLMGLGLFRYVDVQFRQSDSIADGLNASLRLTPMKLQSLRAEVEMVNKNNGFAGPGLTARYRHRNLMRGAEQFQLNLNVSQETQVGGRTNNDNDATAPPNGLNSFAFGAQAQLDVPRFMTPFNMRNLRTEFVPRTRFTLGYSLLNRVDYFIQNAYNATYGYVWKPNPRMTHELTPVNVQYAQLSGVSDAFTERLETRPYLKRSFEQQFILGSMYNFIYNTQNQQPHRQDFYFNANIDLSGNLMHLLTANILKQTTDPNTVPFVNRGFSQYSRLTLETRYYRNLTRTMRLATRMIIGAGIPYGNSRNLPYIKQYFIGGANSVRSYRPRELGPGTFQDPKASSFFDQTGDIKFETNAEFRFDIIPYLKGAVFVDAGNIWLARKDPAGENQRVGGEFVFSKALSQLAVGTGAGLRVDAQFFVLRLDLGIPLVDPNQDPSYVLKIPPKRQNMLLHIAIGYPF